MKPVNYFRVECHDENDRMIASFANNPTLEVAKTKFTSAVRDPRFIIVRLFNQAELIDSIDRRKAAL